MRLPKNMTVYIGGKKFTRNIPDELVSEELAKGLRSDTKPLKTVDKKEGK